MITSKSKLQAILKPYSKNNADTKLNQAFQESSQFQASNTLTHTSASTTPRSRTPVRKDNFI